MGTISCSLLSLWLTVIPITCGLLPLSKRSGWEAGIREIAIVQKTNLLYLTFIVAAYLVHRRYCPYSFAKQMNTSDVLPTALLAKHRMDWAAVLLLA